MNEEQQVRIRRLIEKGVDIHCPDSVDIGPEVDLDRISGRGVRIHTGSRIHGRRTLIMSNAELGREAPVTVENCQIGPNVKLGGGFFSQAVFLDGAAMASGAHVRQGTILEEGARGAHTVALKQTILFPFVTLGSLINFCDCLMAGGTNPQNHSEVGSSYIHFNYTPNQDKATASLIGDVPRGVMLNQSPIFLGGQGGLVGPRRIAFGSVVAAGTICRQDELRTGRLILGGAGRRQQSIPFLGSGLHNIQQTITNNSVYIANLFALQQWYLNVRRLFIGQYLSEALFDGLMQNVNSVIEERIRRLSIFYRIITSVFSKDRVDVLGSNTVPAKELEDEEELIEEILNDQRHPFGRLDLRDRFMAQVKKAITRQGKHYVRVIQSLDQEVADVGTFWLQNIVKQVSSKICDLFLKNDVEGVTDG